MADLIQSDLKDYADEVIKDANDDVCVIKKHPDGVEFKIVNVEKPARMTTVYSRPGNLTIKIFENYVISIDVHKISKVERHQIKGTAISFIIYDENDNNLCTLYYDDDTAKRIFETAGRPELIQ